MHDRPDRDSALSSGLTRGRRRPCRGSRCRIDGCDTLPKLFLRPLPGNRTERIAHREKHLGIWQEPYSWREFLDTARAIGLGLCGAGTDGGGAWSRSSPKTTRNGSTRIIGIQCVGGIVSAASTPTGSAEQLAFLLRALREPLPRSSRTTSSSTSFSRSVTGFPDLLKCVVHGPGRAATTISDEQVLFLDELCEIGRRAVHAGGPEAFRAARWRQSRPAATSAILIYTSGTTGTPKGAMISQENIVLLSIVRGPCRASLSTRDRRRAAVLPAA